MRKKIETRNEYGIEMCGRPLDGEKLKVIPFNMLDDLQTILCYDYEDGKPWHDMTCVMELIFNNFHDEINNSKVKRIRYLYEHPFGLCGEFAEIMSEAHGCMIAIRMDLTAGFMEHDNKDKGICFEDFDEFQCSIRHKKKFHIHNPDMPVD